MPLKPKITIEELIRILNESKDLSDSETAKILNKNYTTSKYGRKFTNSNVQAARYALGIETDTTPDKLGSKKIEKVRKYLAKEIKKANDGDKVISKNDIIKKAVIKFDIKPGKRQPKQKLDQPRYRLESRTYPILDTLESTDQKIDNVLKRMLMDDKPLGDLWYKTLAKRTGLTPQSLTAAFKAGKVPTYNVIKDQGADLIIKRLSSGAAKQILSELSFSEQLTKAPRLTEGRPIISFGQDVGKTFQPKYTIMNFAFRNWDQNLGKGPIEFFDKKDKPIPWDLDGKKLKGSNVSFSYKGKKYNLQKLSDTDILKKDFPEAYKIANQATNFKNKEIDNPFKKSFVIDGVTYKPGDKIPVTKLVKKIQVDGYKWSPRYKTIDVLHGPKGVKGEPFTNLRFNTSDINTVEMALDNSLRAGNITQSQFNKALKTLNAPFAGLKGKDYEQAIIKRLETQAKDIQKKTFSSFDQFQNIIRQNIINKAKNNEDNVCEVVFGVKGQAAGGTVGGGCAKQMELEFDKAPEQTLNKISQSNSPKLKTFAQRALSLLPKLGTPGKIAAGAVAGAGAIGALTYNRELGEFVNPLNDDKASQGTLTEWIKENPVKTVAGTSIGFSAQEIPGAYKKARELGRGRTRSALGITGALKPVLTTFGTPAMTALFEVPFSAKRLEEGETMTEVLSDPLGPALGLTFMEPLSRRAGVIRGGAAPGIMSGIKRAFNPFDLADVGKARPGLTSKILRMGMSPRVIAGISRLGPYGMLAGAGLGALSQYQKYQNQEGMIYNFFNKDE